MYLINTGLPTSIKTKSFPADLLIYLDEPTMITRYGQRATSPK